MGITYRVYLDNNNIQCGVYACANCKNHLSTPLLCLSKEFHGLHGKAFLFERVVNINISKHTEERMMTTGKHRISFISCVSCEERLGWKYIKAYESDQKYKEGKYILEQCNLQLMSSLVA